jgi:hypothetical protein
MIWCNNAFVNIIFSFAQEMLASPLDAGSGCSFEVLGGKAPSTGFVDATSGTLRQWDEPLSLESGHAL